MDASVRFALFASADAEPETFTSRSALARAIHGKRRGAAIELDERGTLHLQDERQPRAVVAVYALDATGGRSGLLGYAWLDGRGAGPLRVELEGQRRDGAAEDASCYRPAA